jgi:hypothetical protein
MYKPVNERGEGRAIARRHAEGRAAVLRRLGSDSRGAPRHSPPVVVRSTLPVSPVTTPTVGLPNATA